MGFQHYFRFSIAAQLVVGGGLFAVSFLLQMQVLRGFIAVPLLASAVAVVLEGAKVLAVVWHRYMASSSGRYPGSTRLVSVLFRGGLLSLSLICSLLYLGEQLDRPRLESVRAADLRALEAREEKSLARLAQRHEQALVTLLEQQQAQRESLLRPVRESLASLQAALSREMDNVVKGQFKGPRYRELQRRIDAEKAELERLAEKAETALQGQMQTLSARLDDERNRLIADFEKQRRALRQKNYENDERVSDPRIVAFVSMMEALFGWRPSPQAFVFFFAILLALLLELGIVLAFDTVTTAMAPALRAQHEETVETQVFSSKAASKKQREQIANRAAMEKIGDAARAAMEEADQLAATSL